MGLIRLFNLFPVVLGLLEAVDLRHSRLLHQFSRNRKLPRKILKHERLGRLAVRNREGVQNPGVMNSHVRAGRARGSHTARLLPRRHLPRLAATPLHAASTCQPSTAATRGTTLTGR